MYLVKIKIIHLLILTLIYQNVKDTFMNSSINMKFTNYINLLCYEYDKYLKNQYD